MDPTAAGAPVVVTLTRGGIPESRHRCSVAAWERGRLVLALGDVEAPVFLRSSAKPLQALHFVLSGAADRFGATEEEIAVVCASHGAEKAHVDLVHGLLRRGGLTPAALACGAHPPASTRASVALARDGGKPAVVHNNCSGKHTGMVLAALHEGAPVEGYLAPDHPVQRAILADVALFAGMAPEEVRLGVDGCSAPNFALPLRNAAAAFSRLAEPDGSIPPAHAEAARRVTRAMARHPDLVAWPGEGDAALMGTAPGRFVSKLGAEGVQCIGVFGRGLGLVLKAEDGAGRPRLPLSVALLRALGVISGEEASRAGPPADTVLRNHRGIEVGRIEVTLPDEVGRLSRGPRE